MIIIGEKLNGSIPSVAKAIAEKDADLIRERARMQAEAGATFLDVCASVEEAVEVETLKWMIDLVQEVTDTPICVDSPSARSCVAAIPFCKRPGLINSVSLEGDKIDTIFPVIADTDWECVALLCDNDGIPDSVERRMKIFFGIMEKADNIYTIPGSFGWDDVGNWLAVERINSTNEYGNYTEGDVITIGTERSTICGDKRLIAAVGVEDLIVVDTDDAVLICAKDSTQDVKKVIENLKICNRNQLV